MQTVSTDRLSKTHAPLTCGCKISTVTVFLVLSVHSDLHTASLFTHKTQEDHQASSGFILTMDFLQASLQKKFHLCRSATGRFQLFNMEGVFMHWPCSSVSSPIFASWASTPLPVNDLTCFGFYRNTLLRASNSVSCQRLQKDSGFIQASHIWPPSVSTCCSDNTPI